MQHRALKIGLTGGVATGKSTVADMFAHYGAEIIDADHIAKSLTSKGHPNLKKIAEHLGQAYITPQGELDRLELRHLITRDQKANQWLKELLHPQIFHMMMEQSQMCQTPYCILMIPLLAESKHDYQLDRICVVDCPEDIQLQRLQQRDTVSAQQALDLTKLQTSRKQRLAVADDIIINDGTLSHLEAQVQNLNQLYLRLAKEHKSNK